VSAGVWDILEHAKASQGETENALSAITVVELTHGIYRAKSEADRQRRRAFVEELIKAIPVHPVTLELAQLAGRIEGEQAAKGVVIALPDLLIGATALKLGYSVATLNTRHFVSAKRTPSCKDSRRIAVLRHDQALQEGLDEVAKAGFRAGT
jgi:predicted nucleic acid-binding protein